MDICLLIYKWCAVCQVTNIMEQCWFQTRFYLLWAGNYTTQAVCATRASDFCNLLVALSGRQTHCSQNTLLPLWETCLALLAVAFRTEQGGPEYFTATSIYSRTFIKRVSWPVCAILYPNNECRHVFAEVFILDNACSNYTVPEWNETNSAWASIVHLFSLPRMDAVTHLDPHRQSV